MESLGTQAARPFTSDVGNLAPELLTNILGHLRFQEGRRGIWPCLLVSRYWSSIAYPLAWDSLSVNGDTLTAFVQLAKGNGAPRMCECVRSLSLQLGTLRSTGDEWRAFDTDYSQRPLQGVNSFTARLWNLLQELATAIQAMENLVSFSLRIGGFSPCGIAQHSRYDSCGGWMASGIVGQLLDALPISCVDLELDTKGREDESYCFPIDKTHLCTRLHSMLPRLRHVRLRLRTFCPSLLRSGSDLVKAPRLLSLTINLNITPTGSHGAWECSTNMGNDLEARMKYHDGRKLQSLLNRELQHAYNTGAFPQARAVLLMILLGAPGLSHHHFEQQDIVHNELYILPFQHVGKDEKRRRVFAARDKLDNESIGPMDAVEAMLENACGHWFTTVEGYRWSSDFRRSGCRQSASLLQPQLETRAQFLARRGSEPADWARRAWDRVKDYHAQTKQLNEQ